MDKYEFVQKIPSDYIGETCVQIMIPHFKDSITFLNSDGMTYHYKQNSNVFVNKYISDKRKEQFPYSDIPSHIEIKGLKKIKFINQLLEFDRIYIQISDGMVVEHFVLKDGEQAFLAKKYLSPFHEQKIMNRNEITELMLTANGGTYSFDGSIREIIGFASDEKVLEWYKEHLISIREKEERFRSGSNPTDKTLTEFIYRSLEKMTPDDVTLQPILLDDIILVSKNDDEIYSIKSLEIRFKGADKYIVDIYDFPITIYSLEHMMQLAQTNLRETPEPIISSSLNQRIDVDRKSKTKRLFFKK